MKQNIMDLLLLLRDRLGEALGGNLEHIVLYGSRARGDENPDSDLDVLVVLADANNDSRKRVHQIAYQLMWDREFQPLISLNIIDRAYYQLLCDSGSSYITNIQREGQSLWLEGETKQSIG